MHTVKIPFQDIPQLSKKDIAYATESSELRPFFKYDVKIESFAQIIADKQKENTNREVLVNTLLEQYKPFDTSQKVLDNINALGLETTFTVTTAHQPSLFTGPLYYIFKIISAIRLAEDLKAHYPGHHFVPVFVSGAEDHDFEEIQYANIFGKKILWENEESGSVGMMNTNSLSAPLEELKSILGESENAQAVSAIFEKAFADNKTYGKAQTQIVNAFFKDYGLVVVDMNTANLKRLFIPILEEEILKQVSKPLIEATQEKLEGVDFGGQAHAREINVFYLRDQIRNRIVYENDQYLVVDTDFSFTEAEMIEELHAHPERFSPNVVMRPLYQELVLPNLAYIGGGGEIAYWLERQTQFEHFNLNFPMLIRRNSVMWIDKNNSKRMEKLGLGVENIFWDTDLLIRNYVDEHATTALTLEEEKTLFEKMFESISNKAEEIDPSLQKSILAEKTRQLKSIDQLENRLHRAEKQKHDTAVNQIRNLKDKLFPGNGLQERVDNFLPLYLKHGASFFETLKKDLNPLEKGFIVIIED
jgi:bacillithiol biosynthesis cysteine-adding enzyme BshC